VELWIPTVDSLITVVPYLLGFAPTKSVVCIWTIDKRISLTMRVDLPVMGANFDGYEWAGQLLSHGAYSGGTDIHVVIFSDGSRAVTGDQAGASVLMQALDRVARTMNLQMGTLASCSEGIRYEFECSECGVSLCSGHDVLPAASELRKMSALLPSPAASRDVVLAEINHVPDPEIGDRIEIEAAQYSKLRAEIGNLRALENWRDESIGSIRREWLSGSTTGYLHASPAPQVARSVVALNDVRCRDAVLWVLARPEADLGKIGAYFSGVVINSPEDLVAGPASVLAAVRWLQGDGLRAVAACHKALEADPDYTLALLVERALSAGLPPAFWVDTMRVLTYEQCRARRRVRRNESLDQDTAMSA